MPYGTIATSENLPSYPRVLVINSDPFNRQSASGFIMRNLFRGWPQKSLAQIYTTAGIEPDTEVCSQFWWLKRTDLALPRLLWQLLGSRAETGLWLVAAPANSNAGISGRLRQINYRLRLEISAGLEIIPYRLDTDLLSWLDRFQPEIIYSFLGGSIRTMMLVKTVAAHCRVPVMPHFMDDWPSVRYRDALLSPFLKPISLSLLHSILKASPISLVISDAMAKEYERRYGIKCLSFMNCIDMQEWQQEPTEDHSHNNDGLLRVMVLGNLGRGRLELLEDLAAAITGLRNNQCNIELSVYTQPLYQSQIKESASLKGTITTHNIPGDEELIQILSKADILVHLESFKEARYFRYSLSGKLPLYLAAGKAILVYGPGENAVAQYAQSAGWGKVVAQRDRRWLTESLKELANSPNLRLLLGQRARQTAFQYHDATIQRARFRQVLAETVWQRT